MARFADYIESGNLPGELRRASYETASLNPMATIAYEANKKWNRPTFKSTANEGTSFQDFLNWQNNPDAMVASKMNLPPDFLAFNQFASQ
jgi:hypothetical protein